MNRREAIYGLGMITGMALVASSGILSGCHTVPSELLDAKDVGLLNEIGEIIIPSTAGCPGAKFAGTGAYIQSIVNDCMKPDDRINFIKGWQSIQVQGQEKHDQKSLVSLSAKDKLTFLKGLDKYVASAKAPAKEADLAIATFQKIKALTLTGYFTSEVGATKALRYDPIPGKFVGVMPYRPGDKVWATNM